MPESRHYRIVCGYGTGEHGRGEVELGTALREGPDADAPILLNLRLLPVDPRETIRLEPVRKEVG